MRRFFALSALFSLQITLTSQQDKTYEGLTDSSYDWVSSTTYLLFLFFGFNSLTRAACFFIQLDFYYVTFFFQIDSLFAWFGVYVSVRLFESTLYCVYV